MRWARHPTRATLQEWLDGADNGIDDHVARCNRCATTLEELDSPAGPTLTEALAAVYEPPQGLSSRLERRVTHRIDSMVLMDVLTDLFGAGVETSKLLLMEEPPHE